MPITDSSVVQCPKCGAKNRVLVGRAGARCGQCKELLPAMVSHPVVLTDGNFRETVLEASGPVLVDLWAPWCGPCKMMAPTIDAVASRFGPALTVGKLDTEQNPRTAQSLQVSGIPTLIVFQGGKPIARHTGAMSTPQLEAWLRQSGAI